MSSESLRETLSALMDDEAEQLEIRRVLRAGEQDQEIRRSWERFQLARSVMHKEPWYTGTDLSASIAAALADEPALQTKPVPQSARWKVHLGRVAVAASVTVAVLAGVRMINQDVATDNVMAAAERSTPTAASQIAIPAAGAEAILAGFSAGADQPRPAANGPSAWQEQKIQDYLRRHAESNVQNAPQLVPYARSASLDNN